MEKKILILMLFGVFFCQQVSANEEERFVEHSCEPVDERNYCVDANGEPLEGKIYTPWPDGGYKAIINYKNGYADGLATYFNDQGKPIERVYYKSGIKNGMDKIYYANRTIKVWANYKNGKLDGWQNFFTPQGRQQGKMYYKNGKLTDGFCISYNNKRRQKMYLTAEQKEQNEDNQLFFCSAEEQK